MKNNLLEKLELQVSSFQESFDILSRAKNLEDMAKKFFHILSGNLLVADGGIYFQKNRESWRPLFVKNGEAAGCMDILKEADGFKIDYVDHPGVKVCVHHPLIDKSHFGLLLGHKLDQTPYNEFDRITLQVFLQQLDSAYQFFVSRQKEKQLIFSLNHRVLQLNSLIDSAIEIARLQQNKKLMRLALERVLALTNASKGMLRVTRGRHVLEMICFPKRFSLKSMRENRYTISSKFTFLDQKHSFFLFDKESREGRVEFDMTDRLLLDAFARQVHVSLENNYLYEQSLEKERIENEISLAGTIQQKLIPRELHRIEGYDLAGMNIPTKHVGGDYYDCVPLNDGRFVLIIADVSGKGIPAALLVSTLQASMRAYMDNPFELPGLVQKLNKVIYDAAPVDKYITAFFAILDPGTGRLETLNAGHNPVYIARNGSAVEKLKTGGIPLGIMGLPFPYESEKTVLNPGDRLLLYTDGVTEAMNDAEEEYNDVVSLEAFLMGNNPGNAKQFVHDLMEDIGRFTGNAPPGDDITVLYIRRNG